MAAHAAIEAPRSWLLVARLKALGGRTALDQRLAAGADPRSALELTYRATILMRPRTVHALARGVERVVATASEPQPRFTAAIPVQRREVLAARTELLRLAAVLERTQRPGLRGVAASSLLLTDGAGPVFSRYPPGALRDAAIRAVAAVEAG